MLVANPAVSDLRSNWYLAPMDPERVELEAKVTFLERSLEAINEAMVEQGRLVMALEARLERLEQKAAEKGGPDVGPHDSKPPHY